ncbi:MAG: reverse transcriptase domain-containing protein [Candidatus Sedimenticola sp. (ex Thyasira tokunagai)]
MDRKGGRKEATDRTIGDRRQNSPESGSDANGAVYEQGFYPFSHGFREAHSAHQAIGEIRSQCMEHGIRWIYDADISGFFDNIDRSWLRRFIQQRINDGGLLRLIGKWLNAGVMEGDQITYSDRGTPQGGTISPCLANIFLHHVLDDWFEREVRPRMRGHCFIVRFADDFVIGFQHEEDARRVMKVLPKRFEKYGLEIHPEKSRLLAFGKPASGKEVTRGDNTFDFLGFTHYWARNAARLLGHQAQDCAQESQENRTSPMDLEP